MHIQSPLPSVAIPEIPLHEFVMEHWPRYGEKAAMIDAASGRTLTYAQLGDGVRRVAAALAARGMKKGEAFCIYSPNVCEYAIAYHGVILAGGVVTSANPLYTRDELLKQLHDSGATRILTVPDVLEKARSAARSAGVKEVFVFGEAEGATSFAELLAGEGATPAVAIDPREDLAALPYSSGTTGAAKGVMLTHYNMVAANCQVIAAEKTSFEDATIAFLPFFHIYGQQVILNSALRQGSTLVVMTRFDFEAFLRAIEQYRISRLYVVPPVVLALSKSPAVEKFDVSSVRYMMSGAAPLGEDLAAACGQRMGAVVRQGYGMTETSTIISLYPAGDGAPPRLDTVGVPAPNSEIKLVDGEVWVRGPQIMKGYLNKPAETRDMLTPDGWLRTGDIGEIDGHGLLRVVDRLKELIKYKGLQVPPAELEAILLSHPAVADAAVIGVPDEEAGEIPKAFVVRRAEIGEEDLGAFVAERVAPHKKIRRWEFVEQIPKSPSGKILRRVLRSR